MASFSKTEDAIMKKCTKCKAEKEISEFQSDKRQKDEHTARCKECLNKDKREYLDQKRDKINEYNRNKYYEKHELNKAISREKCKAYREKNRDLIRRKANKTYWNNVEHFREKARQYAKTERNKKRTSERLKSYRKRDSYKVRKKAWSFFERALKNGYIIRPSHCDMCKIECKPDGHHHDYSKPLDVQWLCERCHFNQHGKLMDIK